MLLRLGADPNAREQGGYTPLHAATQNGDEDMIRLLLYGGADLTLRGKDGKTPLDLAMESADEKTIMILREGITKRLKPKRG